MDDIKIIARFRSGDENSCYRKDEEDGRCRKCGRRWGNMEHLLEEFGEVKDRKWNGMKSINNK